MLKAIFSWFTGTKPDPRAEAPRVIESAAPYKVETPVIAPVVEAKPVVAEPAPVVTETKKKAKPAAKKAPVKAKTVAPAAITATKGRRKKSD